MFRANNYTPELSTGSVFRLVGGFLMAPPPYWCGDKFMKEEKNNPTVVAVAFLPNL
jgi:hypothetical protein